jgi:glycosyltransferase involved in cell wall biosynthesis
MLMPSEMESFGLVALEAMACEVPTIGTLVGGVPEVITNGETGLLFDVGDVDAMAAGAISLLTDPTRRAAMGRAGRRDAQQRFCSTRIVPMYEKYYEDVLGRSA